jgi:type IV pilus assembly protein PilY1
VEVSRDGGSTYTLLDSIDVVGTLSATRSYKVIGPAVSAAVSTGVVRLRFRIVQGFNVNPQHVAVDNVQIQHNGGPNIAVADSATENLVNWMRGQDVKDEDGDGNTDEDRPWSFASPQHSKPLIISYGNAGSTTKAEKQPIEKMVLGTSDGGLRMINAANGIEEFVFYVPSMLKDQPDLFALADSGTTLGMDLGHAYGVDGSPRVMRIDNDADGQIEPADGDRVLVYVGLRRGGNEIYALDISPDDADGLTDKTVTNGITPKFMWRIRGGSGAFSALGQTWSSPQATRIAMGTATAGVRTAQSVVIFGGGYDTSQDNGFGPAPTGNAVFVVDPTNAAKILSIGGPGSGADLELPGMVYPIPGDITLMDSNGDAVTDRLYFADTGGQVWRVDLDPSLTAGNPGRTAGARLAVLSDQSATAAPADQRRFYYPPEVTRITDMERYAHVHDYDVVTITSGYTAHPLDTSVHDRVYAIRDYLVDAPISLDASTGLPTNFPQCAADGTLGACGNPLSETNLYNATDNLIQDGDDTQIAAAQVSLKNSEGWYIAFKENFSSGSGFIGEKGLSKTVVLDGILFFTTFIPPQQSCGGEVGYSRLWAVELLTGEAVFPAFDGNPNQLARTDRSRSLGSGLPAQPVPMFLPSGLRILLGSGDNLITFDPGIATPIRRSYWYEER